MGVLAACREQGVVVRVGTGLLVKLELKGQQAQGEHESPSVGNVSVRATEGDGGTERGVSMAAAPLASDSVPVTFLCALFALFIQQTFIGGQLGTGDMAMNTVNTTPPSSRLSLPAVTWASIIIPIVRMKKLLLREMRRPEDTKQVRGGERPACVPPPTL